MGTGKSKQVTITGAGTGQESSSNVDKPASENVMEVTVCKKDDMKDGEMKEVEVGEGKVLLVRQNGQYSAIGTKCTHYGAPLIKGALCGNRVRCPWHGACFNVKTGDIEDFPGLDSVPVYQVEVHDSDVVVKTAPEAVTKTKRVKQMSKKTSSDSRTFLIVGSGPASTECAETLRQEGFQGRIIMATKEKHLPYDKPKLSKSLDMTAEKLALRDAKFFKDYDIELQFSSEATSVDFSKKTVCFKDGRKQNYDKLFIATGGTPRVVSNPGHDLSNVCYLRTPEDGNFIYQQAAGKQVVIVGTSFIGMEVAAFLASKASSVSVIGRSTLPFQNIFGERVGELLKKLSEEKGIKFHTGIGIQEFTGENGRLTKVCLTNGIELDADICVIGVGVLPATNFVKNSGLEMTDRGHIVVDKCMKTSKDDVYSGGDIVVFPLMINNDSPTNIQHWQMATKHGNIAAKNMLGKKSEIDSVPFFWTSMHGKNVRYTGYGEGFDDVIIHGELDNYTFVAYYTKGDKVVALASMGYDPIAAQAAEVMNRGHVITKSEVIGEKHDSWLDKLTQANN